MFLRQQQCTLYAALCCLLCALMGIKSTSAFTSETRKKMRITKSNHPTSELCMSSFFADATPPKQIIAAVQTDANGNAITVGQKVTVVSNNVKAHHVAKSLHGSFDSTTKEFLPQDETNKTRNTSCLLLPVGLRGEVITVHDTNAADRPHPILVKFGEDEDDGYSLPSGFTMHLGAHEVMVVL